MIKCIKSAEQAQRSLSVHDQVANLFRRPANSNAADHRQSRDRAFTAWAEVTGIAVDL
jgi:putative transposase